MSIKLGSIAVPTAVAAAVMNGTNLIAVSDIAAAAAAAVVMNGPELRLTPAHPETNGSHHTRENREGQGKVRRERNRKDRAREGRREEAEQTRVRFSGHHATNNNNNNTKNTRNYFI